MKKLFTIVSAVLFSTASYAQALPFVAVDYNPVTAAKGGTRLTELSSVAFAAASNPAAVSFSDKTADFSAGYCGWAPSSSNVLSAAGAYKINESFGMAADLSYGMLAPYDITDASGMVKGTFRPSDITAGVGLSWRFLDYLSAGVSVRYSSSRIYQEASYGALSSDIFLMGYFNGLVVTAGVSDLGTKVKAADGTGYSLPSALCLGTGYGMDFGERNRLNASADFRYFLAGALGASAGIDYTFDKMLSLRAGYNYGGNSVVPDFASAGIGLRLKGFSVDASYLFASSSDPVNGSFSVSLGYAF